MIPKPKKGFTLLEMVVYIAVLAVIIGAVSSLFLWAFRSQRKARAIQEVADNGRVAMGAILQEIREAKKAYLPTSVFDSDSGQLSLETAKYLPAGETTAFVDFYLCQSRLCLKKEGEDPLAVTSGKVRVKKLRFTRLVTNQKDSFEIDLEIDFNNPKISDNQATIVLNSVASPRSY
ncbi:MAG: type II secretion system protein [bacterium]|nr:type II secretion system protein [bacterium]